jgi:hypothetical protein
MLIKKTLLAAAAVMSLAVPAAALAQDFGGYHDGWQGGARYDGGRYEQHRDFVWRQIEREREIRRDEWRARYEHRHFWRPYGGFYHDHGPREDYRPY